MESRTDSMLDYWEAVHKLTDGPDTDSMFLTCDPYIKLTLHDGRYDEGGIHCGEQL